MAKKVKAAVPRREKSLSRERIVEATIALLDSSGEGGLTFRALSERLATGAGAIYWHVSNRHDLMRAACDAVIVRALEGIAEVNPEETIRAVSLALFDLIDERPWVGSALNAGPGELPIVRVLERIGQAVRALGIPEEEQWAAAGTLMAYILGVSQQNAANGQLARTKGLNRADVLDSVASAWAQLPEAEYPFTRSVAPLIRDHDDRVDFLAGIDLILRGMGRSRRVRR